MAIAINCNELMTLLEVLNEKVMPKIEFFIVCDYIPDTNIKNTRL